MALRLNPGVDGELVSTDLLTSEHWQRVKLAFGPAGAATLVDPANPIPFRRKIRVDDTNTLFTRYATLNGDGVTFNLANDYSAAPVNAQVRAEPGTHVLVRGIAVALVGTGNWRLVERYAGDDALVNGINFTLRNVNDDSVAFDFNALRNVRTTLDFTRLSPSASLIQEDDPGGGGGSQAAVVVALPVGEVHLFTNAANDQGIYFNIELNDDFTSRVSIEQSFRLLGRQFSDAVFDENYELIAN